MASRGAFQGSIPPERPELAVACPATPNFVTSHEETVKLVGSLCVAVHYSVSRSRSRQNCRRRLRPLTATLRIVTQCPLNLCGIGGRGDGGDVHKGHFREVEASPGPDR